MRVLSNIKKYRADIIKRKIEPSAGRSKFRRYRYPVIALVVLARSFLVYMVCFCLLYTSKTRIKARGASACRMKTTE